MQCRGVDVHTYSQRWASFYALTHNAGKLSPPLPPLMAGRMADVLDVLAAALDTPRLPGARCRGEHELFDRTDAAAQAEALACCTQCPALQLCRDHYSTHERPAGMVVAGIAPAKRESSSDVWLRRWRQKRQNTA